MQGKLDLIFFHARQLSFDNEIVLVFINIQSWRPAGKEFCFSAEIAKGNVKQPVDLIAEICPAAEWGYPGLRTLKTYQVHNCFPFFSIMTSIYLRVYQRWRQL